MEWKILVGVIPLIILLGCSMKDYGTDNSGPVEIDKKENAIKGCKELCKAALEQGIDLSNGPCLSTGNPEWKIKGWVCDVAHIPRAEVDNNPENQCPEFGVTVSRFVEVTPQCTLIRAHGS